MFRAHPSYEFSEFDSTQVPKEYIIAIGDLVQFNIYSKDAYKLIDLTTNSLADQKVIATNEQRSLYLVEYDGFIKLPVLGRIQISGMSLSEARTYLEEQYMKYYNNPFVTLSIENRRVIVFTGEGKEASVVPLRNEQTTLIEVLAQAGGLSDYAQAKNVKVIRDISGEVKIFKLDLSKISSTDKAAMLMQAGDVVYVRPDYNILRELVQDLAPALTLLSTTLSLIVSWQLLNRTQ